MRKLLAICMVLAIAIGFGFSAGPAFADDPPPVVHEPPGLDPHESPLPVEDAGTLYKSMPGAPVYVDPGGIGDVLLFSLFDVRPTEGRSGSWVNYIAIENTSPKWTAFHLRFRAWKKSIEVFDHVILLSPYDVFWMTLTRAASDGPGSLNDGFTTFPCTDGFQFECDTDFFPYEQDDVLMYSLDVHTLWNSGLIYEHWDPKQEFWLDKFQDTLLVDNGFVDGDTGKAPKSELWAGYIEAIGLWQLDIPGSYGDEDTHEIEDIVANVHPDEAVDEYGTGEPTINVFDVQDALFYRFLTSTGYVFATAEAPFFRDNVQVQPCDTPAAGPLVGNPIECWSTYPVSAARYIDSAWPDFAAVRIQAASFASNVQGLVPLSAEPGLDKLERDGLDCGNVLTGNVAFGDPSNGKFQAENFIALRNFRTNLLDDEVAGSWLHTFYTNYDECEGWETNGGWRHRDGFAGGGIFFPASVLSWTYEVRGIVTGGSPETYLWYYVNPNWATAVGPTLLDGDDLYGLNFNDVNPIDPEKSQIAGPGDFLDAKYNPMQTSYGLTRPYPLWLPTGYPVYSFVHYFNDIWSLDDVEVALAKYQIWYTHKRIRRTVTIPGTTDTYPVNQDTDVVLTYPTKHSHTFFTDWPFMWYKWDGYCDGEEETLVHPVTGNGLRKYHANLYEYRGNSLRLFPAELGYLGTGTKSVEKFLWFTPDPTYQLSESITIPPYYNNGTPYGMTISEWYQSKYKNGPVYLFAYIWDNEQNTPPDYPKPEGPGSPWKPDPEDDTIAPHEVNIIRAGYEDDEQQYGSAGIGIGDANLLLWHVAEEGFGEGHFQFTNSYLLGGQRKLYLTYNPKYFDDNPVRGLFPSAFGEVPLHVIYNNVDQDGAFYLLPPIGIVISNHDFGGTQGALSRSNMAEWHYIQDWIRLNTKCVARDWREADFLYCQPLMHRGG